MSMKWVVYSGASRHCSAEASDIDNLVMHNEMGIVSDINCKIQGSGNVTLNTPDRTGRSIKIALKNVLYVLDLSSRSIGNYRRLLNVRLATVGGFRCSFATDKDSLENDQGTSIPLSRSRGLVWLPTVESHTTLSPSAIISRDPIHRRCGYLHEEGLLKLDKLGIDGVWGFSMPPPLTICSECAVGKSKVHDINRKSTRDRDPPPPFHTLAIDIWGPMSTPDIGGSRWFLGAACYNISTIIGNLMKHKSDAPIVWKSMIASVQSTGHFVCRI